MSLNDVQDKLREINDEINELQYEYFTCDVDSLRSLQIEYELECLYHLKNNLKSYDRQTKRSN